MIHAYPAYFCDALFVGYIYIYSMVIAIKKSSHPNMYILESYVMKETHVIH